MGMGAGGPGGWKQQGLFRTLAGSQQVVQTNGHVYKFIQTEGCVPTRQLPADVLPEATAVVYQSPVVPPLSCGQGPGQSPVPSSSPVADGTAESGPFHIALAHSRARPVRQETRMLTLSSPEGVGRTVAR
jgi:hypothetical protein